MAVLGFKVRASCLVDRHSLLPKSLQQPLLRPLEDVTPHPDARKIISMMEVFIYTYRMIQTSQFLKGTYKLVITGS
jgi:hypothetical protein